MRELKYILEYKMKQEEVMKCLLCVALGFVLCKMMHSGSGRCNGGCKECKGLTEGMYKEGYTEGYSKCGA